jgi:hypothetical protein
MCLRTHRIAESMRGGLTADYAKSEGRAFSWTILFFAERHGSPNKQRYWTENRPND